MVKSSPLSPYSQKAGNVRSPQENHTNLSPEDHHEDEDKMAHEQFPASQKLGMSTALQVPGLNVRSLDASLGLAMLSKPEDSEDDIPELEPGKSSSREEESVDV